jgi:hypothetical protein
VLYLYNLRYRVARASRPSSALSKPDRGETPALLGKPLRKSFVHRTPAT